MFRYIGYACPLPTNEKERFRHIESRHSILSMALENDPLEILLQNNAESIALDPWALKTYIRNGLLGAENESFRDPRMLSTPCTHGIVPLIYVRTYKWKSTVHLVDTPC